jgi:DNA invertase Pin-like site-specific DNA recombinase
MKVKYNRLSTLSQSGNRLSIDKDKYDLVLLDRVSGSVAFMERPKGKELAKLVNDGVVKELVVEEFSRLGRNTGDVIRTLEWLEEKQVNVIVRNIGLQSRPTGTLNPIWKMISSVMSSMYEAELENIKARTAAGRMAYVQRGGVLGRRIGTTENEADFLKKEQIQQIARALKKGLSIREICKVVGCSNQTVLKTKRILSRHNALDKNLSIASK